MVKVYLPICLSRIAQYVDVDEKIQRGSFLHHSFVKVENAVISALLAGFYNGGL